MKTALLITLLMTAACTPNVYRAMSGFGEGVQSNQNYNYQRAVDYNHRQQVEFNQRQMLDNQRRQNIKMRAVKWN